jgi:hypothetical protein
VTGHAGTVTVTDTDQATVSVTASNAAINVVETASVNSLPAGGGPVTYTYIVTNKGNVALASVSVIDDKCAPVNFGGGDANGNSRLDVGETWTYTCNETITETTTNTVLATGFAAGSPVTDTDTALVTVGTPVTHTPRIGLTLTANPVVLPDTGGNVTYTYVVANKGDVALSNIVVTDDRCSPIGLPTGDANANGQLDLAETWTFSCVLMVNQTVTNTADASGEADGQTVTAMDMSTVTLTPPAPTPTPTDSPAPTAGEPTAVPTASPTPSGGGIGASGAIPSPNGSVQAATGAPKASQTPGNDTGNVQIAVQPGHAPSPMVMILILMLGIVAAVLIMTLSKRTSAL